MKLRQILLAIAAVGAIGLLAFLLRMTQGVDADLHLRRVALIRLIDNLDVQINRTVMQSRFSTIMESGQERVRISGELGEALAQIGAGGQQQAATTFDAAEASPNKTDDPFAETSADPFADSESAAPAADAAPGAESVPAAAAGPSDTTLRGLTPELDEAVATFVATIEEKFVLAFDFEARNTTSNQRLINSLDAVPVHAGRLRTAVKGPARDHISEALTRLTSEVAAFAVTPTPSNHGTIQELLGEVAKAAETQPQAYKDALAELQLHTESVIADKGDLTAQLNGFLDRPTTAQLREVERHYMAWHQDQVDAASQWRNVLAGYAVALLFVIAYVGWRLRNSYRDLDAANATLARANITLEDTVQERTKDLTKALRDLRDSEAQLVQSEKMASLGQMVAGVAHEINTPLGYARSNASIVRTSLAEIQELCAAQNKALELIMSQAPEEAVAAALAEAQERVQSVNPAELSKDLDNLLADADHGLAQITELVGSLKDFSRVDRSRSDVMNLNECIDSALKIAHNQLKHRVEVVRSYAALPKIECSPSQLNQVFLNLFTNAAQAIDGNGKIFVHTQGEKDGVVVRILDTGCGMTEEVKARIFEPFFTTKPVGKGTGLGLSIVFRIVEDHGGRIVVRSTPGKGSEFTIHLPLKQQRTAAEPVVAAPAKAAA